MSLGLNRNEKIMNEKRTKFIREMVVPGILNTGKGQTTSPARVLKKVLGLI
jgi:hypothetical protein